MIEARDLSMRYGAVQALADATFTVRPGEVVGLLGPNGAGKTTTMRILTTFQRATAGTARVAGLDVSSDPLEVRRRIGYLPESLPLYLSMEVREYLEFVGRARGLQGKRLAARTDWVVEKTGLGRMFRTPCLELSKGFRQRTALAQALLHDPDVVILDEPTSGLDPHQIRGIRALVRELAATKTVLLSTHILGEASALADRLLVLSRGRIVGAGSPDELRTQAGVRARVRVRLVEAPQDAAHQLSELPGAGEVVRETDESGSDVTFDVEETGSGLAEAVGAMAHERGLRMVLLERTPGSLEEVFLRLTGDREIDRKIDRETDR